MRQRRLFTRRSATAYLVKNLLAGLTVAIVALPLAMALAVASGADPATGLLTAIVAGFLISALGGSRVQVGGPTGAFIPVIYAIIATHGYDGLVIATLMAGVILVVAGLLKVGTLMKYLPQPLVTGFTAGIAVIIFASQLKDLLGLQVEQVPVPEVGADVSGVAEAAEVTTPVAGDGMVAADAAAPAAEAVPDKLRQILMSMPELVRGDTLELRVAADRLREAGRVYGCSCVRRELPPGPYPGTCRPPTDTSASGGNPAAILEAFDVGASQYVVPERG